MRILHGNKRYLLHVPVLFVGFCMMNRQRGKKRKKKYPNGVQRRPNSNTTHFSAAPSNHTIILVVQYSNCFNYCVFSSRFYWYKSTLRKGQVYSISVRTYVFYTVSFYTTKVRTEIEYFCRKVRVYSCPVLENF